MSTGFTRIALSLGLLHIIACGEKDSGLTDIDNDGVVDSEDCDDQNAAINSSATDTVGDDIDQNCDGVDGTDSDGDGLASVASGGTDCDDADPDAEASSEMTFYADKDGDGFGNLDNPTSACEMPLGYVDNADDCDDEVAEFNPRAIEACDGYDNDCDGLIDDEDDSVEGLYTTYTDNDGDGFGDDSTEMSSCVAPEGNIEVGGDCDDANESINPNKEEGPVDGVDQNCDGIELCYIDVDGDGFGADQTIEMMDDGSGSFDCDAVAGMSSNNLDCDDDNSAVHPSAVEVCDSIDNDCDALVDDEDDSVDSTTGSSFFVDNDGDGYGLGTVVACEQGENMALQEGDCDDALASSNPMATDIVGDGFDQNCDGIDGTDVDGDGYASTISGGLDCNDQDQYINPDAQEICSGIDEDCDGYIDDLDDSIDLADTMVMYPDADGDGYGNMSIPYDSCGNTAGYVLDGTDCNDTDAMTYPGAAFAQDADACLTDADGDGWGNGYVAGDTCFTIEMTDAYGDGWNGNSIDIYEDGVFMDSATLISGSEGTFEHCAVENSNVEFYFYEGTYVYEVGYEIFTPDGISMVVVPEGDAVETGLAITSGSAIPVDEYVVGDCDDEEASINPDALEICDGIDNNCDAAIDEGVLLTYFMDNDADGYGDQAVEACSQPAMTVLIDGDCDDADAATNPMASEVCDEVDNNCDGLVDEGVTTTFYVDADGDGFGLTGQTLEACSLPQGGAFVDGDCDDTDMNSNPDAAEQCDGLDNNCDGVADEGMYTMLFLDEDGDGYGNPSNGEQRCIDEVDPMWTGDASDCDDSSPETYPGAAELEANWGCMADVDGDGYGDANPPSYVDAGSDCDDNSASAFPGSAELESTTDCMEDTDGDGYGNSNVQSPVVAGGDCQDTLVAINPMATDIAGDMIDQNCDGVDGTDFDGDGDPSVVSGGTDCDDNDATVENLDVDGDGTTTCDRDCDDTDAATIGDDDGDGFYVCEDDCDDTDAAVNPDEEEVYYDGIDANCDGLSDFDQDMDGEESSDHGGVDCDDLNADVNTADDDNDGFSSCDGDCWDSNEDTDGDGVLDSSNTYPGAAFNESATECLTDDDGDGYAPMPDGSICYTFETFDSYGDGWNGNALEVYESGMLVQTIANENLNGVSGSTSGGESNTHEYCVGDMVSHVDITFVDGSYNNEIEFELFSPYGELIASGYGDGTTDLVVNGTAYTDGDIIFGFDVLGSDCDDTDPNLYGGSDNDGDGYSGCYADCDDYDPAINAGASEQWYDGVDQDCDGLSDYDQDMDGDDDVAYGGTDCDDTDANLEGLDLDGDGVSSCDGDCDDSDATIYTGAPEVWYDGIDQDCAGDSDYDQDGDGEEDINYGGTDCDDLDDTTVGDDDGDGYYSCAVLPDCDDGDAASYPGANDICGDGIDQDCDGVDADCTLSGAARHTNGTWLDVTYEVCSSSGGCTSSQARSACTSVGKKVLSHASNGSSSVYSLGATDSCQYSTSYFTVNQPMDSNECLVAISNLDWSGCCTTSRWHGQTMQFGSVGSVFGYVSNGNTGYVSSYTNTSSATWGCQDLSSASSTYSGCSTYYVACY